MKTRHWIILAVLAALLVIAGILFLSGAPHVTDTFPADQSPTVPAGAPVRIAFSSPVQHASAEEHFSVEPAHDGRFSWRDNTLTYTPATPWPGGATIRVRMRAGVRADSWLPLSTARETSWSFQVETPMIAYLWPADDGTDIGAGGGADLYAVDPISGNIIQLTRSANLVDYWITPNGLDIYFGAYNTAGGADLYHLNRLEITPTLVLDCQQDVCHLPQLSPQGDRLAFERIEPSGKTQVWLLPQPEGDPRLAGYPEHETLSPSWSSAGWLAVYNISTEAYHLSNPATGEVLIFPNETGERGSWSADGQVFVAAEINFLAGSEFQAMASSHLIAFDRRTQDTADWSGDLAYDDRSPVFSPDGRWLAFARKLLNTDLWAADRQLWLMRSDGSNARPLTNSSMYIHHDFAWSTDSRQLAYVRFNQDAFTEPPELWIVDVEGFQPTKLLDGGYAPQWMP